MYHHREEYASNGWELGASSLVRADDMPIDGHEAYMQHNGTGYADVYKNPDEDASSQNKYRTHLPPSARVLKELSLQQTPGSKLTIRKAVQKSDTLDLPQRDFSSSLGNVGVLHGGKKTCQNSGQDSPCTPVKLTPVKLEIRKPAVSPTHAQNSQPGTPLKTSSPYKLEIHRPSCGSSTPRVSPKTPVCKYNESPIQTSMWPQFSPGMQPVAQHSIPLQGSPYLSYQHYRDFKPTVDPPDTNFVSFNTTARTWGKTDDRLGWSCSQTVTQPQPSPSYADKFNLPSAAEINAALNIAAGWI